jgi:hypothetical protein
VESEASRRKEGPASAAVVAAEAAMMEDAARRVEVTAAEAADSAERVEERRLAVGRTMRPRGVLGVRDAAGLVAAVHGVMSLLVRDAPAQAVATLRSLGEALVTNVRSLDTSVFHSEDTTAVKSLRAMAKTWAALAPWPSFLSGSCCLVLHLTFHKQLPIILYYGRVH